MIDLDVAHLLTRPRSPLDRFRQKSTSAGAAAIGTALLMTAAIAGIKDDTDAGGVVAAPGGMARFLSEPGLRPGAMLAAVLLVVPFLALTFQAMRVGRRAHEHRQALIALAGATPADLQRLGAVQTATAFGYGGLLAAPLYLICWLILGRALPFGSRLLPTPTPWLPLVWVGVIALLMAVGAAIGARETTGAGMGLRGASRRRSKSPRLLTAVVTGVLALALIPIMYAAGLPDVLGPFVLGLVVLLVLSTVFTIVAFRTARVSGSTRARDQTVELLAAAQRRGDPRAAGSVAAVLFVCGVSFGLEVALIVDVLAKHGAYDAAFYVGGALLAAGLGAAAVVVTLSTMALSVTDQLLGASRSVASVAALGAEHAQLVAVQTRVLAATAVPATVIGTLVAIPPGATALGGSGITQHLTIAAVILAVAAAVGMLVAAGCRLVAGLLAGRVKQASDLSHLRTP